MSSVYTPCYNCIAPSINLLNKKLEGFTENTVVFSEQLTNGGDVVTDSALKELEARNKVGPTQTSKSTLIIHSVQRVSTTASIYQSGVWSVV